MNKNTKFSKLPATSYKLQAARGFTLIELLVVISLVTILAGGIGINIVSYQRNQALDLATQQLAATIRDAQNRSVTQNSGLQWGIYFKNEATSTDFYALFAGSSYSASATTTLTYFSYPIEFSIPSSASSSEVTFAQLSGLPNASTTVSITNGSNTKSITIDSSGAVRYGDPTTSNQVTGLSATAGDAQVTLAWSAPYAGGSPITNYKIYRGTSPGGETLLTTIGNTTTYNDTSVANGTTYYYKVSAVNGVGEGALSAETSATPLASGALVWAQTSNISTASDTLNAMVINSGYLYAAGDSATSSKAWRIEKRSASDGSLAWSSSSDLSIGDDSALAVATDGSYLYVAGYSSSTGSSQWEIKKVNFSDGSTVWSSSTDISTGSNGDDKAHGIAVASGYVYVVGYAANALAEFQVMKLSSADGSLVWATSTNTGVLPGKAFDVAVDSDYVYIAGTNGDAWYFQKRLISNGSSTVSGCCSLQTDASLDTPYAIALDSSSNVYAAGMLRGGLSFLPGEWDSSFTNIWYTEEALGSDYDEAFDVALDNSSAYWVGYDSNQGSTNYEWRIEKRALGISTLTWATTTNPSSANDVARAIAVDNNYIYIGGYDSSISNSDTRWRIEKRAK